MKIHKFKLGCTPTSLDDQQVNVVDVAATVVMAEATGKSSDDQGQGQPHSAMKTHGVQIGGAPKNHFKRTGRSRIKVKFQPPTNKVAWKKTRQ